MLTVGTDCSGIDAPIQAFRKLGIPICHVWSSDIDKNVRKSIEANYHPERIYTDLIQRNHTELPHVDWYVAGFPCQTFSIRGSMKGFQDPRGQLFFHILETIKASAPNVFILENVRGILSNDNGNTFKRIMEELGELKEYSIEVFMMNALDYGSPQSRTRVFFIGIRTELLKQPLEFPEPIVRTVNLSDLLEEKVDDPSYYRDVETYRAHHKIHTKGPFMYDTCTPGSKARTDLTTTCCILTTSRIFVSTLGRMLTPREHLRLQGFPDDFKIVVPKTVAYKQAGNSMNVNVLCAIYKEIFKAIGYEYEATEQNEEEKE